MECMKESKIIYTKHPITVCPYCEGENKDWYEDPCGQTDICDHCDKEYSIAKDAKIEIKMT